MYTFLQPQCWTPTNYAIEWTVIPELDQPCDWPDLGHPEDDETGTAPNRTNHAIEWTVIPELDQPCDWSDFGYLEDCTFESIFLVGVHPHPIM
jgi:hypothetical protein